MRSVGHQQASEEYFDEGELSREVVVSKMEITTRHGAIDDKTQTHSVDFYHLDAIIAVGYRVNSIKATRFRQWATKILNEYIRKGFVMDDDRLKQGSVCSGISSGITSKSAKRIYQTIAENPVITTLSIAQELNLPERYVEKHIKELKELGLIERIGPKTKGGGWRIVEE